MTTNLKELQQLKKEGKKQYPFLTPLTDYISKHYGEIEDELEVSHIDEIQREIKKSTEENIDMFAIYVSPNKLRFIYNMNICKKDKADSSKGVKNLAYCYHTWSSSNEIDLSEVYYISDVKAYFEHLQEELNEAEASRLAEREKQLNLAKEYEVKRQEQVKEATRLREKFNLKQHDSIENAELFEKLIESKDLKTQYEAFDSIVKNQLSEEEIEDIARDTAADYCEYNY